MKTWDTPECMVSDFKSWLSARNDEETFKFIDNEDCLLARFLKSVYPSEKIMVGGYTYRFMDNKDNFDEFHIPDEIISRFKKLTKEIAFYNTTYTIAQAKLAFEIAGK